MRNQYCSLAHSRTVGVCDEIVSWASTYRDTLKQSSKTCSAGRKTPRYSQNRAKNYGLRQNRLLGISVSRYTETLLKNVLSRSKKLPVHSNSLYRLWFGTKSSHLNINVSMCTKIVSENVLSGSKNPEVQSKRSYKLWFATKSSAGHKRVEGHRNTPKNVLWRSKKLPGTVKFGIQAMICDEIVSWASTCRDTLKPSWKTCAAGQRSSLVHSNSLYRLWFGTKSSHLGINVSMCTKIVSENVLSGSNFPGTVKTELQSMVREKIVCRA